MEKKFYTDNFERLLKEKSDEFRMYPSKRVWHSIYNDLHPGRKWPSVAMSMILVITLLLIGSLNTNDNAVRKTVAIVAGAQNAAGKNSNASTRRLHPTGSETQSQNDLNSTNTLSAENSGSASTQSVNVLTEPSSNNNSGNPTTALADVNNPGNTLQGNSSPANEAGRNDLFASIDHYIKSNQLYSDINELNKQKEAKTIGTTLSNGSVKEEYATAVNPANEQNIFSASPAEAITKAPEENKTGAVNENIASKNSRPAINSQSQPIAEEKAWMEDYALHNKSKRAKWKDRVAMEIYATPSLGYRLLSSNIKDQAAASAYTSNNNSTISKTVSQKPALNLEAGVDFAYSFAKRLKLKTGVQLNYTSYGVHADETNHPILTTLMLNDPQTGRPYLTARTSTLSNSSGLQAVTVHNTTYQVSVPVGLALKLAGNNKMEWHIGASIQPSFVFGGLTNFISSDYNSYVSDPSLLRRWNMNTGVETYLNYKMNGFTLQVGPQFRYQLLSTYTKKYTVNENLYNIGIKVGLVKNF